MNILEAQVLILAPGLRRRWDRPTSRDWAAELATFPLFAGIGKRRLRRLVRTATLAEFMRGETILFKGDRNDGLYVILSGEARALPKHRGRALRTGDYFGDIALIDGHPRSASVVATRELHVMRLPSRSVLDLARRHPAMTLTMLKNLAAQLRHVEAEVVPAA